MINSRIPLDTQLTPPRLIGPLIRFFAHLILILRNLNQPVPDTPANAILQAYLQILEREGNDHLVAMYAACLREGSGEDSYARFLYCKLSFVYLPVEHEQVAYPLAMDPAATKEARVEALSRAKTHNLDVAAIALETVRLTLEEAFAVSSGFLILDRNKADTASRLYPHYRKNNPILQCSQLV